MTAVLNSVAELEEIVRGEYREIPGMQLTTRQAQRLWNLDERTCGEVLDALVREHFLRRTDAGLYARFDLGDR